MQVVRSCLIPLIAGLLAFLCGFCFLFTAASATGTLPRGLRLDVPLLSLPGPLAQAVPTRISLPDEQASTEATSPSGRGQIHRSTDLEVTLLSARRIELDKTNSSAAISVLVRNIGGQTVNVAALTLQFKLVDVGGAEYAPDVFNASPNSIRFPIQNLARGPDKPLAIGQSVEGDITFALPRSAVIAALQWWPSQFEPRFRFPIYLH